MVDLWQAGVASDSNWNVEHSSKQFEIGEQFEMSNGVPRNFFFRGGGVQQIQLRTEDRENGDLGAVASLVRGSGYSCNLVQEISFHIAKFS